MASPADSRGSNGVRPMVSGRPEQDTSSHGSSSVPCKRPAPKDSSYASANPGIGGIGAESQSRPAKKRAPKACASCRDRKVRCDVVSGGWPCTNCRLDEVDCILMQSNRGKNNSGNNQSRARTTSTVSVNRPSQRTQTEGNGNLSTSASASAPATASSPISKAPEQPRDRGNSWDQVISDDEAIEDDDEANHIASTRNQGQQQEGHTQHPQTLAPTEQQRRLSSRSQANGTIQNGLQRQQHDQSQSQSLHGQQQVSPNSAKSDNPEPSEYLVALAFEGQGNGAGSASSPPQDSSGMDGQDSVHSTSPNNREESSNRLPPYIRPFPSHLEAHDIEYLARKDCLTIPDNDLRDELIRIYVFVVYPFMPAVDLENLLTPIVNPRESGTISLLLFQAIMFASVIFIDTSRLQSRGFETKRAARKVFFNRVKLLYSLDYEADRITLVQSLLLMTYWYDTDSDDKHTWYWMGLALTTAQVEGLHRSTEEPSGKTTKVGRLRRRLWWSCVIRDRLLGLGIRRPSRIREDDFSAEPLRIDDFDVEPPVSPTVARLLAAPRYTGPDPSGRRAMAMICIDLSKLCITIGRILHSQYTIASTQQGSNYLRKAIVRPRSSNEQVQEFSKCDSDLHEWFQNLPEESRYAPTARDSVAGAQAGGTMVLRLHQTLLYMNYLTTLGALHRPQVFYSGSDTVDLARKADSRRKVTDAAVAITKLAFELQSNNQMCFAPTSSIPAFLSAALIHLLNTRSLDEETRNISIGRFSQCLDALHQLQYMYAAADQAVRIVNNVLENAGLVVPLLGIGYPLSKTDRTPTNKGYSAGVASWGSRMFTDMWPSRVATAYPSPAAISNQDGEPDGSAAAITAKGGATGFDGQVGGVPMTRVNPTPFPMPNVFDVWNATGNLQGTRGTPLPSDAMPGSHLDLDAWYDVGDILDPALMTFDFEVDPHFLAASGMPM